MRWLDGITDFMDMSLNKLQEMVRTGKPGMLQSMELQSQTWLNNWTTAVLSVRFSSVKSFHTVVWWVPRTSSCRSRFLYFFLVFSPLPSPVKISFTGFFFFNHRPSLCPLYTFCRHFGKDTCHPCFSSSSFSPVLLLFICSVTSYSLLLHGLQHARLPCPSRYPGVCSN